MKKLFFYLSIVCAVIFTACDSKQDEPKTSGGNSDEFIPYNTSQNFEYLTIGDFIPLCGLPVPVLCQKLEEGGYMLTDIDEWDEGKFYTYRSTNKKKGSITLTVPNDALEMISYEVSNLGMTPETAKLWLNQMGNKCLLPTYAKMQFEVAAGGTAHLDGESFLYIDQSLGSYSYDEFQHIILPKLTVNYGIEAFWRNVVYQQYPEISYIKLSYYNYNGVDYGEINLEL